MNQMVLTLMVTADTKEQLDSDTESILALARQKMCQMAVLTCQQLDGLKTVLPLHLLRRKCHLPQPHHV